MRFDAKPTIYSMTVNDSFPIDIQYRNFKRFMTEDFEFVLLNDAYQPEMETKINDICATNGIKCIRVPQEIHPHNNPSEALGQTLNWVVHYLATGQGVIGMFHTDVFPISKVSLTGLLGHNFVAGTAESKLWRDRRVTYIYPAMTIINMGQIDPMDLDFGLDVGLDTGGLTYRFVDANPSKVRLIPHHQAYNVSPALPVGDPFRTYLEADVSICRQYEINAGWVAEGFYHYLAGSRWNASSNATMQGHDKRMELFLKWTQRK